MGREDGGDSYAVAIGVLKVVANLHIVDAGIRRACRQTADILGAADEHRPKADAADARRVYVAEEAGVVHVGLVDDDVLDVNLGAAEGYRVGGAAADTDEPSAEWLVVGADRCPQVVLHVVVGAVALLVQVHFVEVELACLYVVQAVDHADEPGQAVLIVYVYVAVVCGHVAVAVVAGIVVVVVIHSVGSGFVVDLLVPVFARAVVGCHSGVVSRHYVEGQRTVVRVEVPHDEVGACVARLGVQVDGVARAEAYVGQLVYGVVSGVVCPAVYVVVSVTSHRG